MPSALEKSVVSTTAPATAVAMKANRSVSTCWKAPSTLRLRRSEPASTTRRGEVHRDADEGTTSTTTPSTSGGSASRRMPSITITTASATSVAPFSCAERISARRKPNVKLAARRAPREPRREQGERDRAGVGEHVSRVGEQRERVGQDAGHDLDRHQAEDQGEGERQAPRVVRLDVPVACGDAISGWSHARCRAASRVIPRHERRSGSGDEGSSASASPPSRHAGWWLEWHTAPTGGGAAHREWSTPSCSLRPHVRRRRSGGPRASSAAGEEPR